MILSVLLTGFILLCVWNCLYSFKSRIWVLWIVIQMPEYFLVGIVSPRSAVPLNTLPQLTLVDILGCVTRVAIITVSIAYRHPCLLHLLKV